MSKSPSRSSTVQRRHVFFIAGFDPKSPRYYHALYRSQAKRQLAVCGLTLEVSKERSKPTPHSTAWTSTAMTATGPVQTVHELLEWDDIVREHWAGSAWKVLLDGMRTVAFGLRDGAVQQMYRLYRPPVYATFLPLVVMFCCTVLAVALGAALPAAISGLIGDLPWLLVLGTGALTTALLIMLSLQLVHRIQFTWVLRLVRFTHLQACDRVPGLDARMTSFAQRICAVATRTDTEAPDEILIVGHSVGATLAIDALDKLIDLPAHQDLAGTASAANPKITLLSLGHCMPLLSSLSPAQAFRDQLQRVAAADIDWLDITAPIDWAAFPQVDPVTAAGLPPAASGWHPLLLSPRFHLLFSPAGYARLKRNRFQVHLQYLLASERPGQYDYFAITAGPQTLRERFDETTTISEPTNELAADPLTGSSRAARAQE